MLSPNLTWFSTGSGGAPSATLHSVPDRPVELTTVTTESLLNFHNDLTLYRLAKGEFPFRRLVSTAVWSRIFVVITPITELRPFTLTDKLDLALENKVMQ